MAIEIYKTPPAVSFGAPIIFGVKDTGLLAVNAGQNCIYAIAFTQGITSSYAIEITYGIRELFFTDTQGASFTFYHKKILPFKSTGESVAQWVARIALALAGDLTFTQYLYVKAVGASLYIIEKSILYNISARVSVYYTNPTGSNYCSHGIVQSSQAIKLGEFHAIGAKPETVTDINYSTLAGTIATLEEDYGNGIEVETDITYTDITNPFQKITDRSMFAEMDVSDLVRFSARAHFSLTDLYVVRSLAQRFNMYFYIVRGTPKVRASGARSELFYVIDSRPTRTKQAQLNEAGTSQFAQLATTKQPLTWAPDNKVIDVYQPERLYHLMLAAAVNAVLKCKEYFSDDTNATHTVATITAQQYQVVELTAAFLQVRSDSGKTVVKYEVWFETSAGVVLMNARTFILSYRYQPYARYWMFKNGWGVYECIRTVGTAVKLGKIDKEFIEKELPILFLPTDRDREQVNDNTQLSMKCSSGPLDPVWSRYFLEFLDSEDVYMLQKGVAIPADIQADDFSIEKDGENINMHSFEALLTNIDEEVYDTSVVIPIIGEYTKDFNEGFLIGT